MRTYIREYYGKEARAEIMSDLKKFLYHSYIFVIFMIAIITLITCIFFPPLLLFVAIILGLFFGKDSNCSIDD